MGRNDLGLLAVRHSPAQSPARFGLTPRQAKMRPRGATLPPVGGRARVGVVSGRSRSDAARGARGARAAQRARRPESRLPGWFVVEGPGSRRAYLALLV